MSEGNQREGQACYSIGDRETKDWFERQWAVWPERADPRLTTNLSFHYGGVLAYRIEHDGADPPMSSQFKSSIKFLEEPDAPRT